MELFVSFWDEFTFPMLFSFLAVLIVILVITSDITATLVVALRVAIGYMMVSRTFNELHNLYEGEKVHDFAHASGCP